MDATAGIANWGLLESDSKIPFPRTSRTERSVSAQNVAGCFKHSHNDDPRLASLLGSSWLVCQTCTHGPITLFVGKNDFTALFSQLHKFENKKISCGWEPRAKVRDTIVAPSVQVRAALISSRPVEFAVPGVCV